MFSTRAMRFDGAMGDDEKNVGLPGFAAGIGGRACGLGESNGGASGLSTTPNGGRPVLVSPVFRPFRYRLPPSPQRDTPARLSLRADDIVHCHLARVHPLATAYITRIPAPRSFRHTRGGAHPGFGLPTDHHGVGRRWKHQGGGEMSTVQRKRYACPALPAADGGLVALRRRLQANVEDGADAWCARRQKSTAKQNVSST
jgi:hypothetical protein